MGLIQIAVSKALAASAFRNGPLEDLHAGKPCPTCSADESYSRISQDEMKALMKHAVDHLNALLQLWQDEPVIFGDYVTFMLREYAYNWDEPENLDEIKARIRQTVKAFG